MEFKSQICTSRSQSERLLALGLKKETADMYYQKLNDIWELRIGQPITYGSLLGKYFYPAWSLHRLVEMINLKIQFRLKEKATVIYNVSHLQPFQSFSGFGIDGKSYYNSIINAIEWLIKEGFFNKDYLENEIK